MKIVSFYLVMNEWYLMLTGVDIQTKSGRGITEREVWYRVRVQTVVEFARSLSIGRVTVALHHWRKDVEYVSLRERSTLDVIFGMLKTIVLKTCDVVTESGM